MYCDFVAIVQQSRNDDVKILVLSVPQFVLRYALCRSTVL